MGRLSTFRAYSTGDEARVSLSAVLLPVVWIAVVVGSFSRVRAGLLWVADRAAVPGDPTPARVATAVAVADGWLPGERTCLVRSLTAETLLRLYGHRPVHRIGVDTGVADGMKAHSWLEHGDEILIGDLEDLDRYTPLPPLDEGDEP